MPRREEAVSIDTPIPVIHITTQTPAPPPPFVPLNEWLDSMGLSLLEGTLMMLSSILGATAAVALLALGGRGKRLDAVLESLTQAKKVTVLDKSRLDWKDFKKTDDAVEEELEAHKRSGATYLEKKAFLGRADLAEYERERDQKLASDVRNRGRL